jgi:hypothetical protein
MTGPNGEPLWTADDVEEAADLEHPPSAAAIAAMSSIVRTVLERELAGKHPAS